MAVEIKVPALGESVTEATVSKWLVKAGDGVAVDQPLCELETDKVTVEVNATVAGTIAELAVAEGATVQVGGVLCHIEAGAGAASPKPAAAEPQPMAPVPAPPKPAVAPPAPAPQPAGNVVNLAASGPAVRKLAEERAVAAANVQPTGKDGRATKADIMAALTSISSQVSAQTAPP
jgi:2-oxoglutarate dehydrogenase E2 component (dihydrolipoamide succinyltransferase)